MIGSYVSASVPVPVPVPAPAPAPVTPDRRARSVRFDLRSQDSSTVLLENTSQDEFKKALQRLLKNISIFAKKFGVSLAEMEEQKISMSSYGIANDFHQNYHLFLELSEKLFDCKKSKLNDATKLLNIFNSKIEQLPDSDYENLVCFKGLSIFMGVLEKLAQDLEKYLPKPADYNEGDWGIPIPNSQFQTPSSIDYLEPFSLS